MTSAQWTSTASRVDRRPSFIPLPSRYGGLSQSPVGRRPPCCMRLTLLHHSRPLACVIRFILGGVVAAGSRMIERKHGGAAVREGGERMPEVVRRAGGIPTNPSHAGCTSHIRPGQDGPGLRGRCTDATQEMRHVVKRDSCCTSCSAHPASCWPVRSMYTSAYCVSVCIRKPCRGMPVVCQLHNTCQASPKPWFCLILILRYQSILSIDRDSLRTPLSHLPKPSSWSAARSTLRKHFRRDLLKLLDTGTNECAQRMIPPLGGWCWESCFSQDE